MAMETVTPRPFSPDAPFLTSSPLHPDLKLSLTFPPSLSAPKSPILFDCGSFSLLLFSFSSS